MQNKHEVYSVQRSLCSMKSTGAGAGEGGGAGEGAGAGAVRSVQCAVCCLPQLKI